MRAEILPTTHSARLVIGDPMSIGNETHALEALAQALAELTGERVDVAVHRAVEERLRRHLASRAHAATLARELANLTTKSQPVRRRVMAAA